jgi:transposase, IS5 family
VRALGGEPILPVFLSFCHKLPFDRSSLTRWRQRLGEEQLSALLQESLSVAHKTGALATRDLELVVVDTTVQGDRASDRRAAVPPGAGEACQPGAAPRGAVAAELRAVAKGAAIMAAIMVGRYIHAHQFKRARPQLKFLRTRLGRVVRDIRRKIAGGERLTERFASPLARRYGCSSRTIASAAPKCIDPSLV